MKHKEPKDAVLLAARMAKAYPSLTAYRAALLAEQLCAIEWAQRRHAERCCSGADGGYVRLRPHVVNADGPVLESPDYGAPKGMVREHDPVAEERACAQVHRRVLAWRAGLRNWIIDAAGSCKPEHGCSIELQGDPRGPVLLLQLPGEGEAVAV